MKRNRRRIIVGREDKSALNNIAVPQLCKEIKERKLCDGIHLMTIGAEQNIPTILEKAAIAI